MTLPQTGLIVSTTLTGSVIGGAGTCWLGDKIGRKNTLPASLALLAAGSILSMLARDFCSPRSFHFFAGIGCGWRLFWGYAHWGLGQGSFGMFGPRHSELFPVGLRSIGASASFAAGRLAGNAMPYLVPIIAAQFHDLFTVRRGRRQPEPAVRSCPRQRAQFPIIESK